MNVSSACTAMPSMAAPWNAGDERKAATGLLSTRCKACARGMRSSPRANDLASRHENQLARASSALEEYDTAVVSLRKLVQLEPGNAEALWALAETYGEKLGMTGKGAAAYRDFERLFPSDSRAGEVAARVKALEEAAAAMPTLAP